VRLEWCAKRGAHRAGMPRKHKPWRQGLEGARRRVARRGARRVAEQPFRAEEAGVGHEGQGGARRRRRGAALRRRRGRERVVGGPQPPSSLVHPLLLHQVRIKVGPELQVGQVGGVELQLAERRGAGIHAQEAVI
jgi:hypothetical protein